MAKKAIQATLQRLLGFENYLFVFSLFVMSTIRWNKKEGDIKHFMNMLDPMDTVLDIGANIGIMTAIMSRACPQGKVIAFEPIPENIKALKRLIKFLRLKNVDIQSVALGNKKCNLEMRMPVIKGVKMQGLSHVHHPDIEGYDTTYQRYKIPQHTLDDILLNETVQAIKIDVENYEYYVLIGGEKLINQNRPLIYMELWDNDNRKKCMELLFDWGYTAKVLVNSELVTFNPNRHSHQNFFFIPAK